MYEIQKNLTRLENGQSTFFLERDEYLEIRKRISKKYKVFRPFEDCEKVIIYDKNIDVLLYEIKSNISLRHQDILGTMYSLNISREMFGDIILDDGHYYIYIMKLFQNYFETNFTNVRNAHVELELLDLDYLNNYKRKYEEIEIIVSSERIDAVASRICNSSRSLIKEKVINKEILLNQSILKNLSYTLRCCDTFSIRKIGKFKYIGIIKTTKSNNYIVKVLKYL